MKAYLKAIDGKFAQTRPQLISRSLLAGIILSMAGFISIIATATINNPVVSALLFSFGLVVIILLGAELFTSNCLIILKPKQSRIAPRLAKVYLFNLLGVVIFTTLLWGAGLLDNYGDNILASAAIKASLSPIPMILSGIVANLLVCVAAWIGFHEQGSAKLAGIIMPIMAFVMIKAEHSIANMFIFSAAIFMNGQFEIGYLNNLLWVTIGNIIGGFCFALTLHYAHKK